MVAQAPTTYSSTVTDNADVLSPAQKQELEARIKQVQKDAQKKIYVVYATDFAGLEGTAWAKQAQRANVGTNVLIVGISPQTRDYGIAAGKDFSDSDLKRIDKAVYSKLVDEDYFGAGMTAADEVASNSSSGLDGESLGWLGGGAAAVGALGIGAYAMRRRSKTKANVAMVSDARKIDPKDTRAIGQLPIEVLEERAREELVSTDESIRRGREELDLAIAEFGAERARPFTKAMNHSTTTLQRAFGLKQRLDDAIPESDAERRAMLVDIISSCGQADDALDREAAEFAEMRNLLIHADTRVEELTRTTIELRTRIPQAEATLTELQGRYESTVIAGIFDNAELAAAALDEAEKSLESARAVVHLPAGEQGRLIEDIRRTETAVQKADKLLAGVEHAEENIALARDKYHSLVAEITAEISEADQLEQQGKQQGTQADWAALRKAVAAAQSALTSAEAQFSTDPLSAYAALITADTHLDEHLDAVRASATDQARTLQVFDNTMRSANSAIQAAEDLISTRGRVVRSQARTQLADAKSLFAQALNIRTSNTRQGIDFARQSLTAAQRAAQSAQNDIDDYRRQQSSGGSNMGGIITGMLINEMLSGGNRGGFGGGFGGGSFGGGGGVTGGKF